MKFATFIFTSSLGFSSASFVGRRHLEEDFSWMSGYTLKYEQCFQDNGQNLVYFSLCPENSKCVAGCEGGTEYVSDLLYFVDAFTEAQLGAREYACEMAREACGDDDEDCYQNYGVDYCDDEKNEGNFNIQEYLECKQYEDEYYIGPVCKDGQIYLAYFTEETCTYEAEEGTFYNTYGYELDYSVESGVSIIADDCANCREHGAEQDQNEGDQQDEDDVLEQCEELYMAAQEWSAVAESYEEQVTDVRVSTSSGLSVAEKSLIAAVAVLAVALCVFCGWNAIARKKNDKTAALLSETK